MSAPASVRWLFAGLVAATVVYCLARVAARRRIGRCTDHDADVAHVVMGVGMTAMLAPWAVTGTSRRWWEILYLAVAVWWFVSALYSPRRRPSMQMPSRRGLHHVNHVVAASAMVFMFAGMSPSAAADTAGMPGMPMRTTAISSLPAPLLAWPLVAYFVMYAAWAATRMSTLSAAAGEESRVSAITGDGWWRVLAAVELTCACQMVMGTAMAYMLLTMA